MSSNNSDTDIFAYDVILNIYDINKFNCLLHPLGLGIYHSSVTVLGQEYSFGSHNLRKTGVFMHECHKPFQGARLRKEIVLGQAKVHWDKLYDVIEDLKIEYFGCDYDLLARNCHHFTIDLCQRLLGRKIPAYVNRVANLGNLFRCLVPKKYLRGPKRPLSGSSDKIADPLNDSRVYRQKRQAKQK